MGAAPAPAPGRPCKGRGCLAPVPGRGPLHPGGFPVLSGGPRSTTRPRSVSSRPRRFQAREQARLRKRRERRRRGRLQDYFRACVAGWFMLSA